MDASRPSKPSAMNIIFMILIVGAILFAAYTDKMQAVTDASFQSAKDAVTLAIGMIGVMAIWLGFIRILEAGGFMLWLARKIRPLMTKLFPDVPAEHPAMSAIALNMSANMLGLGNAATPLGLKAMGELNKLNPIPGTATNAMCLFLVMVTSSVTLLPLGVIGVRAAAGATEPAAIFLPTLIATVFNTLIGIMVVLWLAKRDTNYTNLYQTAIKNSPLHSTETSSEWKPEDFSHLLIGEHKTTKFFTWLILGLITIAIPLYFWNSALPLGQTAQDFVTYWLIPVLILLILTYGFHRGVKIYEAVTEGAKQGFEVAIRIIPFLVAILVGVGMFRASGAMDILVNLLQPITNLIYMPAETLPMALVRPLSGSGAFGIMSSLVAADPNSYAAYVASVMQGATDTTFYILAVYFGSVGINNIRHALVAGIIADATGMIVSCLASAVFYTP